MKQQRILALVFLCLLVATVSLQSVYSQVTVGGEPNGTKAEAEPGKQLPGSVEDRWLATVAADINSVTADWWDYPDKGDAKYGLAISTAADFNDDGYDDLIVGAYHYDYNSVDRSGRAWMYFGSATGLSDTPDLTFNPPKVEINGFFGTSVGRAGDVNGDKIDDVIIGMDNYNGNFSDEGAAYVYYGSKTPDTTPDWMAHGDAQFAHFGVVVSTAGDVNGDTYDDIIVGAYYYPADSTGAAFLWFGDDGGLGDTGTPANADWKVISSQSGSGLNVVGTAGDVNGDTYDDIIVGAPDYDNGQDGEGLVMVWHGSSSGPGGDETENGADWIAEGEAAGRRFGDSIGALGDVNNDGYDDIIIGSFRFPEADYDGGDALAFYGSENGLGDDAVPGDANWSVIDPIGGDALTFSVQKNPGADVNGDGYDDAIIGINGYDVISGTVLISETLGGAGAVAVWYGSEMGLLGDGTVGSANWLAEGSIAGGYMGRAVDQAGDVNGNGLIDVAAGAPYTKITLNTQGAAYAYYSLWSNYMPLILKPG